MFIQSGLIVLSIMWILLCLRFYTLISRENTGQRRLLAIAAGLGAGLIYVLGNMIVSVLQAPSAADLAPPAEQVERVRVTSEPKDP